MILALFTIHLLTGVAPPDATAVEPPGVSYRADVAGATAAPWVNANGWQYVRTPGRAFTCNASGPALPLAMAEAFAWHGNVWFQVSEADRPVFDRTLEFLHTLPEFPGPPRAQIGVAEDGSAETGEVLKLLIRRNLMAAPASDRTREPELMVKLGTPEYPRDSAQNPAAFAAHLRTQLGDDHRLLRIYGTDVVLGRLEGGPRHTRLHLLNYSNRDVYGPRIRVLGLFRDVSLKALDQPDLAPQDISWVDGGTEFTIPVLARYAVVDLEAKNPKMISKKIGHDFELTADPGAAQWKNIPGVSAANNFLGEPVPLPVTEIRSRWTAAHLYLLFTCPYEELNLKPDPVTAKETPKLWDWDVAEAFLGSDFDHIERYREFQVSPQGEWVDLDIDRAHPQPDGGTSWNSGFAVKARIDHDRKVWYGEMKIPLAAFTPAAGKQLRIGLFRIQGAGDRKQYIAWQPTGKRSFHVPEAFGLLEFEP
ncbi:MAG: carbohydrate-binding family 9-like protein [Acidobacteriota bacterium]|nr:carbohydrate-binding family 9-like protein [Acidobacteriota bacterium]